MRENRAVWNQRAEVVLAPLQELAKTGTDELKNFHPDHGGKCRNRARPRHLTVGR